MRNFLFLFLILSYLTGFSQVNNINLLHNLPDVINETSGLLYFNNRLITHNDSGDTANLYEIDLATGNVSRIVSITNATNVDWEDITQDNTHIYVGDIGNNSGSRQDLKIYKIAKADYLSSDTITAEIINFSYNEQTIFTSSFNNHNFDAEALSFYNSNIILFTKNWTDNTTDVYEIPTTAGNYNLSRIASFNTEALVTGSTYNASNDSFLLCGYQNFNPVIIHLGKENGVNLNSFDRSLEKVVIGATIGNPSQTEAIALKENNEYFLSREATNTTVGATPINVPTSLFSFQSDFSSTLSNIQYQPEVFYVYPNPTTKLFTFNKHQNIKKVVFINTLGEIARTENTPKQTVDISSLNKGIYIVKIYTNTKVHYKKIIKL